MFSGLIAERTDSVNLTIDGLTRRAIASLVSGNYFEVLGVRPLKGRLLAESDDRIRAGHPVVVLSYGFWVERLGARSDIIGGTVRIGGHPFTVVGIAEKRFNGLEVGGAIDIFVPVMMLPEVVTYAGALDARTSCIFQVCGASSPASPVSRPRLNCSHCISPSSNRMLRRCTPAIGRSLEAGPRRAGRRASRCVGPSTGSRDTTYGSDGHDRRPARDYMR